MQKTKIDRFIAVFTAFFMLFCLPMEAFPGITVSAEEDPYIVSYGSGNLCLDEGKTYPSNTPATLTTLADSSMSSEQKTLLAAAMLYYSELSREFTSLDQQSLIWGIMGKPGFEEVITYIKENLSYAANQADRVYILTPQDSTYQRLITTRMPTRPDKYVTISFSKSGSDNPGGNLAGATFSLNNDTFTTSSSGPVEKSLTVGTRYTLREISAPNGYKAISDSLTFTADENGNITPDGAVPTGFSIGSGSISCVNQKLASATVTIQKVDDNNQPLTGAEFTIKHGSETVSVNSNGSTKTAELFEGESYTITESTVPSGYTGAGSMSFTVSGGSIVPSGSNESYSVSGMTITCKNKAIAKVNVTIKKVDRSGNLLSGATLVLSKSGYSSSYSQTITSSSETVELEAGNYTLSEKDAPDGYKKLSNSFGFTVSETGIAASSYSGNAGYTISGDTIIVTNEPLVTKKVAFRKVDGSGAAVSGATFTLRSSSSSYSKTVTSASEEWDLEVGETYTLTEDEAPTGYKRISGQFKFTVESETSIRVESSVEGYSVSGMTITVVNVPVEKKVITIRKIGDNGTELSGFTLSLSDDNGFSETITSSGETVELPVGSYTLTETSAPTGYVKLSGSIRFTVSESGISTSSGAVTTNGFTLTVINNMAVTLKIKKIDDNGNTVSGAKFSIYGNGQNDSFTVNSTDGYEAALESGVEYTLSETEAPAGYEKATGSFKFKVVNGDIQTTSDNSAYAVSGTSVTVTNKKLAKQTISFSKVDNHGDAVSGAKFKLTGDGTQEITLPVDLDLYVGPTYTLTETEAPSGYEKTNAAFSFQITSQGTVVPVNSADDYAITGRTITVTNQKLETKSITFKKIDDENQSVQGAVFTLTDEKTYSHQSFTSSTGGNTLDLIVGRTYRLTETSIPDGHDGVGSLRFNVTENGIEFTTFPEGYSKSGNDTIVIVNKKLAYDTRRKIRFSKVDESGKVVKGAVFSLTDGETSDTLYFDGTEVDKVLVVGSTYILTETTTPEGYISAGSFEFKVTEDGLTAITANENYSVSGVIVTITDKTDTPEPPAPSNKDVVFNKVDENGNALSGATFRLTGPTTEVLSFSGSPITKTLVTGEQYTLTEIDAPDGYASVSDFRFTVNEDGTITYSSLPEGYSVSTSSVAITITNKREPQKEISFRKVDENGSDLSGAVFTLSTNGKNDITINCTGSVVAKELAVGRTYTLTETKAPTGYRTVKPFTFKVLETGVDYTSLPAGYDVNGSVVTIANEPVPENSTPVIFSKIDESNKKLSGAVFTLTHGSDSDTLTFTGSDITEHLEIGETYTVKETTVPTGYTGSTGNFTFKVTASGIEYTSAPDGYTVSNNKITIVNTKTSEPEPPTPSTKTVKIIKMDATNNVPLASAKLRIVKGSTDVKTWTSTTEAYSVSLTVGETYTLKEIKTPEGYTGVTSDFTFTVTAEGLTYDSVPDGYKVNGFTITVENTENSTPEPPPEDGKKIVKILKIDATNNTPLAGAKFKILDGETVVKEWTSTASAFSLNLETDKTYTLKEVSVPEGYTGLTNDLTFTVTDTGITCTSVPDGYVIDGFTVTVKNTKNAPENPVVKILKVDENNKSLAGAKLQIVDVTDWTSTTTAFEASELEIGKTYTLKEIKAPEGYTAVTADFTFTVEADGLTYASLPAGYTVDGFTISVKNTKTATPPTPDKPVVKILKVDAANHNPLAGAALQILENGTVIKEWTSTTNAFVFDDFEVGHTYAIREKSAPEGYKGTPRTFTFTITADSVECNNVPDDYAITSGTSSDSTAPAEFVILVQNTKRSTTPPTPDKPVVKFLKVTASNNAPLAGATLQILENGSVIKEWTSTTNAYEINDLIPNVNYVLHEASAPAGYKKAADISFRIGVDGTIYVSGRALTSNIIVMADEANSVTPPAHHLYILKIDEDTNQPLAGAHFQILDGTTVVKDWISTTEKYDISGLTPEKRYVIHEVSAPDGYLPAADTYFIPYDDGVIATTAHTDGYDTIIIKNKKISVKVSKIDSSSRRKLSGATLAVYCNGKMVNSWITDGTTEHTVTGLNTNTTYVLREIAAPYGYKALTYEITFTIDDKGVITTNAAMSSTGTILVENSTVSVVPCPPQPSHYYPPTPPTPVIVYIAPDYPGYTVEDVAAGAGMVDDGEEIID